ncbi:hypothetical protein SELMODRAFT_428724 [Selaginella moellendorffii]|uniref:Uncharacterized protein n=1 Tax=Selaginella moellendorffii TaxID=88036 RepID=D8T3S8_SELML|nr:hypothetical protein SELMODRAFT_428724 [Selaginella moellendorffii]
MDRGHLLKEVAAAYTRLTECFQTLEVEDLSDPSLFLKLPWPSVRSPLGCAGSWFSYLGRERAKEVYNRFVSLPRRSNLLFTGVSGSGKTVLAAAIAGHMLVRRPGGRRLVYIVGHQFALNPVTVLKEALLLAFADDESTQKLVLSANSLLELVGIFGYSKHKLMFVVDEWNCLDTKREKHVVYPNVIESKCALKDVSYFHVLVKVASTTSESAMEYHLTDKKPLQMEFNGPFTVEEFKTWLAKSPFGVGTTQAMVYHTGLTPRLLQLYVQANQTASFDMLIESYTRDIIRYVGGLEEAPQLELAMRIATEGAIAPAELKAVPWSCAYIDVSKEITVKLISRYLADLLAAEVMNRSKALSRLPDARSIWAFDVRKNAAVLSARNSARLGWNVEALVVNVVKAKGSILGHFFSCWKEYDTGHELEVLVATTMTELLSGVLFCPRHFNEKAVDLVWLQVEKGGEQYVLVVEGVQISVSSTKRKLARQSHIAWKNEILPQWLAFQELLVDFSVSYTYVLPHVCHQDTDLAGANVSFRNFAELDGTLAFVDQLRLPEPEELAVEKAVQCSGFVNMNRCKHFKRGAEEPYFCCPAHEKQQQDQALEDEELPLEKSVRCSGFVNTNRCKRVKRGAMEPYFCCPAHEKQQQDQASQFRCVKNGKKSHVAQFDALHIQHISLT